MKLGEIKSFSLINIMESTNCGSSVILESAAEMVRTMRTKLNANGELTDLGEFWSDDNVVKFCAGLERIDTFINKAITDKKLDNNTRDAAFSAVMTADFDDAVAVQKIIKQSDKQPALISKWSTTVKNKGSAAAELDKLAKNISATAALLRTKGAQTITTRAAEPTGNAGNAMA